MNGIVNCEFELTLDLPILGRNGETHVKAVIDTCFDGFLSLSYQVIVANRLPQLTQRSVTMADGSRQLRDFFGSEVFWDGQRKKVRVLCMPGDALIGTALLRGYKLEADFVVGGLVRVVSIKNT